MPKPLHDALVKSANKHKNWSKAHKQEYIYGGIYNATHPKRRKRSKKRRRR